MLSRCDNSAVVSVLHSRTSREEDVMHLLRCLHFYEAYYECTIVAEHIPGVENGLADDLSRNRLLFFLQKVPEASANTYSNGTCGVATSETARLAVPGMKATVQSFFDQSLAPSTRKTYLQGYQRYVGFCTTFNI